MILAHNAAAVAAQLEWWFGPAWDNRSVVKFVEVVQAPAPLHSRLAHTTHAVFWQLCGGRYYNGWLHECLLHDNSKLGRSYNTDKVWIRT